MSGPQFYDASAAGQPGGQQLGREQVSLSALEAEVVENELFASLERVQELMDRSDEREREEQFDPGLAERMDRIAGAVDAPLELRSLARRVAEGRLTWKELWLDPAAEAGGLELIRAVTADLLATTSPPPLTDEG